MRRIGIASQLRQPRRVLRQPAMKREGLGSFCPPANDANALVHRRVMFAVAHKDNDFRCNYGSIVMGEAPL